MNTNFHYTVVGMFVVILLTALLSFFIWLSAFSEHKSYQTYVSYVDEAVSGLSVQNAVKFNGVPVGYVSQIALDSKRPQHVKILMKIEKNTPITTSTIATLSTIGVTGVEYIELSAEDIQGQPLKKKPFEQYPVIPSKSSLMEELGTTLHGITMSIRELSTSIQNTLNRQNQDSLQKSLKNITVVTQALANHAQHIESALEDSQHLLANLSQASQNFPQLSQVFQQTLKSVQMTADQLNRTSENISQQLLPSAVETMNNMETFSLNLKKFSNEIKRHPSIMVRGKIPDPAGPGERQ
jgi:phospholipid/cholesterol/gamma-HCH transport system substrate-binding protein